MHVSQPEHKGSEPQGVMLVSSESMGQINKATRLIQLITPCEVVLYSSFLAEGRYHVAAVRALSCVILRLHLHRECSG